MFNYFSEKLLIPFGFATSLFAGWSAWLPADSVGNRLAMLGSFFLASATGCYTVAKTVAHIRKNNVEVKKAYLELEIAEINLEERKLKIKNGMTSDE